jgi:Protein of unknown function (DUF1769)
MRWLPFLVVFHIVAASPTLASCNRSSASSSWDTTATPLPAVEDWPHRPVYLQAGGDTRVAGHCDGDPLPLGVPFEFETPIFRGRMLLRVRNAKSDDAVTHGEYFRASNSGCLVQTVVQGQFKKPVRVSDVFVGSVFERRLRFAPPAALARIVRLFLRRLVPGMIVDLQSEHPKVIALYAGTAASLSIDIPGNEPDVMAPTIPENTSNLFGNRFRSIKDRKQTLSLPDHASDFLFDTDHVYTFHTHDDAMDYASYSMHIPIYGSYDISQALGQPMSLTAVTKQGETMFAFHIWHESLVTV